MRGSSLSNLSSTSHPSLCVSPWCKDSGDCDGVVLAWLLQLDPVRQIFVHPQQTTATVGNCLLAYRFTIQHP